MSINGKKTFKRISRCPFGGRRKVQVKKFALEDFIFVVFRCEAETLCCCNKRKIKTNECTELTLSELCTEPRADRLQRTRSAHHLSLQDLAAVPTPNIAELVPSVFFCPQLWFLRRSKHIFPGKTPVFISIESRSTNSWHLVT